MCSFIAWIINSISDLIVLYQSSGLLLDVEVVVVVGSRESCPTGGALAVGC